eukprot:7788182-Alexandrium_andersonii.AAC.1
MAALANFAKTHETKESERPKARDRDDRRTPSRGRSRSPARRAGEDRSAWNPASVRIGEATNPGPKFEGTGKAEPA